MSLALSTRPQQATEDDARDRAALRTALEHAVHLLPSQAPIRIFVHHNTLHAFQHLPFDEAVVQAAARFGTEPYQSEAAFGEHLASGRITARDLAAVLADEDISDAPVVPGGPSVRALRARRLQQPIERLDGAALAWLHDEGELFRFSSAVAEDARSRVLSSAERALGAPTSEAGALAALYARLSPHAPARPRVRVGPRPRDRLFAVCGQDTDALVRPLLVRICAAFVDQGVAYWSMPHRELGLLGAFRALYAQALGPMDPWMHGLASTLARHEREGYDAERTAIEALTELRVPRARWEPVIEGTLRALPGWAGMISHLELRPDRAPVVAPPSHIVDFLALALVLEAQAAKHILRSHDHVGTHEQAEAALDQIPSNEPSTDAGVVYEAFILAQLLGIGPAELDSRREARSFVREVDAFGSFQRRRLWHLAYEHHHRAAVLDGLLAHARLGNSPVSSPSVQAVFCFDEREESLRRHLEEVYPSVETVGFAGNYGLPIAYRSLTDLRPKPLCPVTIRPRHVIVERAIESTRAEATAARRRLVGTAMHAQDVGSKTFIRGALSASVGILSVLPLIARSLFPRLAERLSHGLEHAAVGAVPTRLAIERAEGDERVDDHGLLLGFTVTEMAGFVTALLRTSGLEGRLAPLVIVTGHGSSSFNNPHEAAHDCGATGGGHGGPNARAFAAMANHPGVRAELASRGVVIDDATWFVAGYHNTCDDAVTWFDLDLVPAEHQPELDRVTAALDRARRLDAQERCRRFDSAPLEIDPEGALAHVETRAVDLGQPRPEYGHATNAVCIVGRRERTRGLFLDRRAFVVSYDPTTDPSGATLGALLQGVVPVGAGINLEYYFSFVDPIGYGSGTKLPHNIVGLVGVMDGHAGDLRTGLPWQMVEIHEPVRLLSIIEAEPELLERLLDASPEVAEVVLNRWIQVVAWSPSTGRMHFFSPSGFVPYEPHSQDLPVFPTSADYYRGHRGHLDCARIDAGAGSEASS